MARQAESDPLSAVHVSRHKWLFTPEVVGHYWTTLNSLPLQSLLGLVNRLLLDSVNYRGTSLIRNCTPLGPYSRTMPRVLRWP